MSSDSEDEVKSGEESEEEVTDLSSSDVVEKYRIAAQIAQQTLTGVIGLCVAGKSVVEICEFGDTVIERQCAKYFKSKKIDKGIAFPTCVSVNECVCHYSPLRSEDVVLKAGDSVKIDLGCHLDGYIAVVAHTHVVPGSEEPVPEPLSNVMVAAHTALEAALRTLKPGATNTQVGEVIRRVATEYGVTLIQGTMSHQMKRYVIDGNKVILQREEPDQKVDECTFEMNEVYGLDVCFSDETAEGKVRQLEARTTVFKRAVEQSYQLKMKASRYVIKEVNKRFATFPFTIRALDERQSRMGVVECCKHELLHQYPVMYEREGVHVAHFKCTALLLPSGTAKITGSPLPAEITSAKTATLPEDLKTLLARSTTSSKSKNKRKKNKAKKAAAAAAAAAGAGAGAADA